MRTHDAHLQTISFRKKCAYNDVVFQRPHGLERGDKNINKSIILFSLSRRQRVYAPRKHTNNDFSSCDNSVKDPDFNVKDIDADEGSIDSHLSDEISHVKDSDIEHECTKEADDTCTTKTQNNDFSYYDDYVKDNDLNIIKRC